MTNIPYGKYISERNFLREKLPGGLIFSGLSMFKKQDEAVRFLEGRPGLFIVSLKVEQWGHTDFYPTLHDGVLPSVFGYFLAYGENKEEWAIFEDFPC